MMKKTLLLLINCAFLSFSFGQQVFTGSILVEENIYSGLAGNLPSTSTANLPSAVDLSGSLPPVGNQGRQNSCVAWAIAYGAHSYYAKKSINNWSFKTAADQLNYSNLFSPSYIYNQINNNQDIGSDYFTALELLKNDGVCTLDQMGYADNNYLHKPSQTAREQAGRFKIERYVKLGERQNLMYDIKEQLSLSNPVIAGAIGDKDYLGRGYQHRSSAPYLWQAIGNHNPKLGHAILIVGYDDNLQAFKFLNSYGTGWGNNGFGWISYSVFNGIVRQAFVMKPAFSDTRIESNNILSENRNNINQSDINAGLNLTVNTVQHMNTETHPHIPPQNYYMTVTGTISIPANAGTTAQIVIYYYLVDNQGRRTPLLTTAPDFQLPSGQAISFTPPLQLSQPLINLGWYSTIPYWVFPRGYNPPFSMVPMTFIIEAEPALLIDNFPVRVGQPFRFPVTH